MAVPTVRTVSDPIRAAHDAVASALTRAAAARGRAVLCLSGGSTPLPLYRRLAERDDLPWTRVWVAWGDERWVPPGHTDRNERAAREALLDHVPVPAAQVLAWPWGGDPHAAAAAHERQLRQVLDEEAPFDATLLGMGADGHVASLFPNVPVATEAWTQVSRDAHHPHLRLTLTPTALSASREVWILVQGEAKRAALEATLQGADPALYPILALSARERLEILTDLEVGAAGA